MDKLYFGTAGVPLSAKRRDTLMGIERIFELGLDAMELEFVRNVKMGKDTAEKVNRQAQEKEVKLTVHAPYYINLNSDTEDKNAKSQQWILQAARIGWLAGAFGVIFHSASFRGMDPEEVYYIVKRQLVDIIQTLRGEDNDIGIRPEVTGKPSYFGGVEELLRLSAEIEGVMPCIDFAHLHARSAGKFNTYPEFASVLETVDKKLGRKGLDELHIHVSGIEYTAKGEQNHLNLKESDFNYRELLKALKDFNAKGFVICESPNLETDALILQKEYRAL